MHLLVLAMLLAQDPLSVDAGESRRPALVALQHPENDEVPGCRVFGRVLDEQGVPIPGAEVRLATVGEPWRADAHTPEGERLPASYEALTGEAGRFSFEVPLPTSSWVDVTIEAGAYLSKVGQDFGPAGGRNQAPLFEGDNDLGDFTLASTGAISGQVVGPDGAGLGNARVSVEDAYPNGFVLNGDQSADGSFIIGHIPPGTYRLKVACEGFQSAVSDAVEVVRRETSTVPEIALSLAVTVAGRVVDGDGRPIAGVEVWGWPVRSGRGAGGQTGADGGFVIALPEPCAYRFKFEAEGYRSIDDHGGDPSLTLRPGATDVLVTMVPVRPVTFRVLDAATGEPVEAYGLRVDPFPDENHSSSRDRKPIPPRPAPGGECQAAAEPGLQVVRVMAEGYAPVTREVKMDAGQDAVQTIRMQPAARVVGAVLNGGQPVGRATVRLERAQVKLDPSLPDEFGDDRLFSDNYGFDLDEFTGAQRMVTSTRDGRFALENLAAGTYRLRVNGASGAPLELDLAVGEGQILDLGVVELPSAGAVAGRVLAPPGVSVAGLQVFLGDPWDEVAAGVEADGSFRFDGLEEGDHVLTIEPAAGLLARELATPFEAQAGTTSEVTIDLRPLQPATVHVVVELNGQGVEGLAIDCGPSSSRREAGRTDRNGALTFEAEPGPGQQVVIRSPLGLPLGTHDLGDVLVGGVVVEQLVPLEAGHLSIEFPPEFVAPKEARAVVLIESSSGEPERRTLILSTPGLPFGGLVDWRERRCDLGPIAPGTYSVEVRVDEYVERDGQPAFVAFGDPLKASIEVSAGGEATASLLSDK